MRLVLMTSTIALAMVLEMNAVPFLGPTAGDASATASQGPVPVTDVPKLSDRVPSEVYADDSDSIAAQVVSLGKSDRLFVVQQPAADQPIEDEAAIAAPPQRLTTGEFCEALAEAAEANEIPVAFFARLIWQESKFKHDAKSQVGAQGVAQFMPRTAAEMGLDDPFDPRKALPASARFLRKLHDQFGNLGLAAAAYNAGSGRIQNWLARRGPLPDETRNYVRKITGNPAETWTSEKKTASLQQELPREAPCEGFGGLSRSKEVAAIPVELKPGISDLIRKAEAEAIRVAAAAKARARLLLAKAGKRGAKDATRLASAKADKKQTVVIAVSKTKSAVKVAALGHGKSKEARRVRVASAK
jgi:soluble lytic murein transglycosylase-like protein